MSVYAKSVEVLIDELGRLPGIGPKSAQRIAFHLLKTDRVDAKRLADAILAMKDNVSFCERCFNMAEGTECQICTDPERDQTLLCVVEEPKDIAALERTGEFRGLYHVLLGAINPLEGIGPESLKIRELALRVASENIDEVILCTNPNLEGETTAAFIATKVLAPFEVKVSRLASGLPVGGDLEYADELTLGRALQGRRGLD
ncbi:MAG: recombination protein RecR [Actinomycetia bacterium]|nr:recombination protein RecR [Actinomycetes bacterium]MCP4228370.1 recombination protein RecR [Actinomycetes bacterium]MCP5030330.1 recombination protein RecR [Actinomycetes bacterium]